MKWVIIALCEMIGVYFLFCSFKMRKVNSDFKFKHMFSNQIVMNNSSWQQLLLEGVLGILLGVLGFFTLRG